MEIFVYQFRCGHTENVELTGNAAYRRKLLEYSQGYALCPKCKREAFMARRQKMAEQAEQRCREGLYPTLTGSVKQVSWANVIREKAVVFFKAKARYFGNVEKTKQIMQELKELIDSKTDASFWIENRARFVLERTNYK